jgi:predicted MFS family arabinose efflux permease|uniref:Major facilitator superfamily MFS_1 n=2 Tax=Ralstonia pickettii TaxID=329 RepID=C6BMA5_RALP1
MFQKRPMIALIALLFIHTLAHIDRNMLLGFSSQVIADLGLSNAQYGFLVGAVWVLSFGVMAVFLGTLADRFSRTRVIAGGLLVWSACTAASGFAQNFEQMAAARFLVSSGEAALVPAAVAMLGELFPEKQRGTAIGLFFMGIPAGIGFSFLLAGTFGAAHGWRSTFQVLGVVGVLIAVSLACVQEAPWNVGTQQRGAPVLAQIRGALRVLGANPTLLAVTVGFVLVHMVFAGLSFTQLWLVRERGLDAATIARTIGALQLIVGTLGSVAGGMVGDRLARRMPGGHVGFMVLLVAICGPLMIAYRFAPPGSALFYVGMCAGFFLPLALYGPTNTVILSQVPVHMRATISGFSMLLINVFAITLGNLAVGLLSDRLARTGASAPLTFVLLGTDVLAVMSGMCFLVAARVGLRTNAALGPACPVASQLHG